MDEDNEVLDLELRSAISCIEVSGVGVYVRRDLDALLFIPQLFLESTGAFYPVVNTGKTVTGEYVYYYLIYPRSGKEEDITQELEKGGWYMEGSDDK